MALRRAPQPKKFVPKIISKRTTGGSSSKTRELEAYNRKISEANRLIDQGYLKEAGSVFSGTSTPAEVQKRIDEANAKIAADAAAKRRAEEEATKALQTKKTVLQDILDRARQPTVAAYQKIKSTPNPNVRIKQDVETAMTLSKERSLNQGTAIIKSPRLDINYAQAEAAVANSTLTKNEQYTIVDNLRRRFDNLPKAEQAKVNSKLKQFGINLKRSSINAGAGFATGVALGVEGIVRTPEFIAELYANPTQTAVGTFEYAAEVLVKLGSRNPYLVGEALGEISTIYLTEKGINKAVQKATGAGRIDLNKIKDTLDEIGDPKVSSQAVKDRTLTEINKAADSPDKGVVTSSTNVIREINVEVPVVGEGKGRTGSGGRGKGGGGGKRPQLKFIETVKDGISVIEGIETVNGKVTKRFIGDSRIVGKTKFTNIIEQRLRKYNPNLINEVAVRRYATQIADKLELEGRRATFTETRRLKSDVFTRDPIKLEKSRLIRRNIRLTKTRIQSLERQLRKTRDTIKRRNIKESITRERKKLRDLEQRNDNIRKLPESALDSEVFDVDIGIEQELSPEFVKRQRERSRNQLKALDDLEAGLLGEITDARTIRTSKGLTVTDIKPIKAKRTLTSRKRSARGIQSKSIIDEIDFIERDIQSNIVDVDIEKPRKTPRGVIDLDIIEFEKRLESTIFEEGTTTNVRASKKTGKSKSFKEQKAARQRQIKEAAAKAKRNQELTNIENQILREAEADIRIADERGRTIQQKRQKTKKQRTNEFSDESVFGDIAKEIAGDLNIVGASSRVRGIFAGKTGQQTRQQSKQINAQNIIQKDIQDTIQDLESDLAQDFDVVQESDTRRGTQFRRPIVPDIETEIDIDITIDPLIEEPIIPIPRKKKRSKTVTMKKAKKRVQGYDVYFKKPKSNKLTKVNKKPRTKARAQDVRDYLIDNSVARTGRIRPAKRLSPIDELRKIEFDIPSGYSRKNKSKFRPGRKKKGKVKRTSGVSIEREIYLIDTAGEKRGLNAFKLAKKRRKKVSKVKKKSKTTKKVKRGKK